MGGYDGGFESGFMGEWNPLMFHFLTDRLESSRQPGQSTIP
jgi:hypothetical protein